LGNNCVDRGCDFNPNCGGVAMLPSRSLTDQYGEWCAECLDYFKPYEARQYHHPLTEKWIRDRFGSDIDFGWLMPTHDMQSCHLELQIRANFATKRFFRKLDEATTLDQREKLTRNLHERGYYWLSVLANLDTMQSKVEGIDSEQVSRRCVFALSSLAGVRGAQNLPRIVLTHAPPVLTPGMQLSLSNLRAARGHERAAKRGIETVSQIIESLTAKKKDSLSRRCFVGWLNYRARRRLLK
jgi:hypothetical protein